MISAQMAVVSFWARCLGDNGFGCGCNHDVLKHLVQPFLLDSVHFGIQRNVSCSDEMTQILSFESGEQLFLPTRVRSFILEDREITPVGFDVAFPLVKFRVSDRGFPGNDWLRGITQ